MMRIVEGNLIDIANREFYPCRITIEKDRIVSIERNANSYTHYILPGFIDAHVHVESSMLLPTEFSKMVIPQGTVAVVNDPHEIANVLGLPGVEFMLANSKKAKLKFFFGIPSCVPATAFDGTGGEISVKEIERLAKTGEFVALSEMMNVPGVLQNDVDILEKLKIAQRYNLKIDGHAPGLTGDALSSYIAHHIETDHECVTLAEAEEKISKGMKVIIREGSAAKNYEALKSLIGTHTDDILFCMDDAHPDELCQGHINTIVRKALSDGFGIFDVLQIACINPIKFYGLNVGMLREGDLADFIVVEDIETMRVVSTYINGEKISVGEYSNVPDTSFVINSFHHEPIALSAIATSFVGEVPCIKVIPNEIITEKINYSFGDIATTFESDIDADVLKIVYVNRYMNGIPQVGLIKGIGLKNGAFASSVSHDSHNLIAVGCSDEAIVAALNAVITHKGGLAVKHEQGVSILPLPVAGIMSDRSGQEVANDYLKLNQALQEMGCTLEAPFMTLSFMALLVIPSIRIGERGIFEYEKFDFV